MFRFVVLYKESQCGNRVAVVWQSRGNRVAIVWQTCGNRVAVVWQSCGYAEHTSNTASRKYNATHQKGYG